MRKKSAIVLGGGIGGLAAGWFLARTDEYDVTIIEKAPVVGGLSATFRFEDCLLDYGPHKWYSVIPGIVDEVRELLDAEMIEHQKRNHIYLFGNYLDYPLRMTSVATKMGPSNLIKAGLGAVHAAFGRIGARGEPVSYQDYIIQKFGRGLYDLVFRPLAEKTWGDPATLSADIARTRIPSQSLLDAAFRAVGLKKETELTDARVFFYPRSGFGRIAERMAEEISKRKGKVLVNTKPVAMEFKDKGSLVTAVRVFDSSRNREELLPCDLLVSSIPLDSLFELFGNDPNNKEYESVSLVVKDLQYRATFLVYIVLSKPRVTEDHWIFFPERNVIFGRIFEQKNMSEQMVSKDKTILCCDFTDGKDGTFWNMEDERIVDKCIIDLEEVGVIRKDWVIKAFLRKFPSFYPRYDLDYEKKLNTIFSYLAGRFKNVICTGRSGFYNYNNTDHCVDMGRFIMQQLSIGQSPQSILENLRLRVKHYRIVD